MRPTSRSDKQKNKKEPPQLLPLLTCGRFAYVTWDKEIKGRLGIIGPEMSELHVTGATNPRIFLNAHLKEKEQP